MGRSLIRTLAALALLLVGLADVARAQNSPAQLQVTSSGSLCVPWGNACIPLGSIVGNAFILGAANIPAPTATTLGGVESVTSLAHNWIAYIDTSGVPHQSQPSAGDISGLGTAATANTGTSGATLCMLNAGCAWSAGQAINASGQTLPAPLTGGLFQVASAPGINSGLELVGAASGTRIGMRRSEGTFTSPSPTAAGSIIGNLTAAGYNGSVWTTSGSANIVFYAFNTWSGTDQSTQIKFFTTPSGATISAIAGTINPSGGWSIGASAADPGTNGLTVGALTTAGIATNTAAGILGTSTLTALMDSNFGSTQGDILCRGPSGWQVIAPAGTANYVLTSGSGSVCPSWATVAGTGNVVSSGTPSSGQLAQWTSSSAIEGITLGTGVATALGNATNSNGGAVTSGGVASSTAGLSVLTSTGTSTQPAFKTPSIAASSSVSSPTAIDSTSPLMMGLGGLWALEPSKSGSVIINISGGIQTTTGSASYTCSALLYYGTGTAPTYGAPATGTSVGGTASFFGTSSSSQAPLSLTAVITGLAVGTVYWFDVGLRTSTSSDYCQVTNVSTMAWEK
jgi:hypothetical protein